MNDQLQSLLATCYRNIERTVVKAKADAVCDEVSRELFGKRYAELGALEQCRVIERAVYRFDPRLVRAADDARKREAEDV